MITSCGISVTEALKILETFCNENNWHFDVRLRDSEWFVSVDNYPVAYETDDSFFGFEYWSENFQEALNKVWEQVEEYK